MENDAMLNVYKCPTCGGAVRYDAKAGTLACMWCGNVFEAEELEPKQVSAGLQGHLCPECGAQLMSDDFIAADTCPYCGNNEVAPHRFEGDFEPDRIIPFSITKEKALECYNAHLEATDHIATDFIGESSIISVQGGYVPFWLKDGVVYFDCTYMSVKSTSQNGSEFKSYFHRVGTYEYASIPADGSERMPDDMMDSVEPYDFDALVPFSTEYLPGFIAERYTVDSEEIDYRIGHRMGVAAILCAMQTVPQLHRGPYIEESRCSARYRNDREEQVLLPVWLIVVKYKGEKYLAGVNGQTGKVAVNLPVNEEKQQRTARKQALKAELFWMVPFTVVMLGIAAVLLVRGAGGDGAALVAAAILIVFSIVFLGVEFTRRFKRETNRILATVQNVKEAKETGQYDSRCMTLTLSENGMGPLAENA